MPRKSDIDTDFASIRVPVRSCSEPEAAADDESAAVVEKVVSERKASVVRKRGCVIAQDDRRIAKRNIWSSQIRSSQVKSSFEKRVSKRLPPPEQQTDADSRPEDEPARPAAITNTSRIGKGSHEACGMGRVCAVHYSLAPIFSACAIATRRVNLRGGSNDGVQ